MESMQVNATKSFASLKLKQDPVLTYIKAKGRNNFSKPYSNLSIKNLSCRIRDNLELKYNDFSIYRGEYVGIVGKSGSGKSTLIDLLVLDAHLKEIYMSMAILFGERTVSQQEQNGDFQWE